MQKSILSSIKCLLLAVFLLAALSVSAQVDNDECAGAIQLYPHPALDCFNPFYGSLYAATPSGMDCQGSLVNDVWYQFMATSTSHRIVVGSYYGNSYGIELFAGDCNNLSSLACSDDVKLVTNLTEGDTYYLKISSATNFSFDFWVCIITLPLPPANDECSGALPLPLNANFSCDLITTGSTLGAISSEQDCGGLDGVHDVWYSFVATGPAQRLVISPVALAVTFGGVPQLGYEVYSGDCNNLNSLLCVPDAYVYPPLLGGLQPGATYYLRVYSSELNFYEFSVCLQTLPPPPGNAACTDAEILIPSQDETCMLQTAGTTVGILSGSGISADCSDASAIGVWYQFTATSSTHVLWISNLQTLYGIYSGFRIELYEGAECNTLTYQDCLYNAGSYYLNELQEGKIYFIRCLSVFSGAHSFNICMSTLFPPANDDCSNAAPLLVSADLNCTNNLAGATGGSTTAPPATCFNNEGDVWYQFIATQGTHIIQIGAITGILHDYYPQLSVELLTGSCSDMSSVRCWDTPFFYSAYLTVGELVAGQSYSIRIASSYVSPVNFNICVLTPPPPPANDACINATLLTPEAGNACNPVAGTTVNATTVPGIYPLCCNLGDVWYTFVATQANHNVSLSDIASGTFNQQGAEIEVYSSACGVFTSLGSRYIFLNGNGSYTNLSPGATYYVRVFPFFQANINFNICILSPPPPPNDECATALPLPVNEDLSCSATLTISTTAATQSRPHCDGDVANDIWYQWTATTNTYRFEVRAVETYYDNGQWGFEILSDDCDNLNTIYCEQPNSPTIRVQDGFIPGAIYYLRLFSKPNRFPNITVCTRALPLPPANDECAGAVILIPDADLDCDAATVGTTLGATLSQPDCAGAPSRDVWYSFTALEVAHVLELEATLDYFGNPPGWSFEVYTGDCTQLTSLFCPGYQPPNIKVLHQLTPGQTYYIRVFSENIQAHDFSICIKSLPPPPVNDECAQATTIEPNAGLICDHIYSGTTLGASFDPPYASPDVWFTLTATSNSHLFELQNVQAVFGIPQGLYGTIYRGSDCNTIAEIGSFADTYPIAFLKTLQPGETIYLRIYPANASSAYTFDLCIKTLPLSPPNEDCAGAIELIQNNSLQCDIVNAASTAGAINASPSACGYGDDVWYKFTATSSKYQIQAINIVYLTGNYGLWIEVLKSSDCANFTSIGCISSNQILYLKDLTPGETYYVKAGSYNSAHNFDICLKAVPPPPNDLCTGARSLNVYPEVYCNEITGGTTYGAGSSAVTTCGNDGNDVWYIFTATQSAHKVYIDHVRDAVTNDYTQYSITLYSGTCTNPQILTCREALTYGTELTIGDLIIGSVYYARIAGEGDGINFGICVSSPPAPPDNDLCATATTLPVFSDENCEMPVSGTTVNANPTPTVPFDPNVLYPNDVWYSFTATQANHLITVSNIINTYHHHSITLKLEAYAGICGALASINIQYPFEFNGYGQTMLTNLTVGTIYYLRALNSQNEPTTFDICVTSPPLPPNDECDGATIVDVSFESCTVGSNYGATQSAPRCTNGVANDIWFQFTATGTSQRLYINHSDFYPFSSITNTFGLEILEGSCSMLAEVVPCTEYESNIAYTLQGLIAGNIYYLRLYTGINDIKNFTICIHPLPEPPVNDNCVQAEAIQANTGLDCVYIYTGSTLGATTSSISCNGLSTHDMWYKFTATTVAQVVDLRVTGYPFSDSNARLGMQVYSGADCTDLNPLACDDYAGDSPLTLNGLNIGATYFIRVFSQQSQAHDFSLCIRALPPPPVNIDCINAVGIVPSPDMTCMQPVSGSTAGLTEELYFSCQNGTSLWYQFTATSSSHFIELQNVVHKYGNPFLYLELYQGDCDGLEPLYCFNSAYYILTDDLSPGATYYIRVVDALNSGSNFDLCVMTVLPPVNPVCSDAVTLPVWPSSCGSPVAGSLLGTPPTQIQSDCDFISEVWYSFMATGTSHIITINNIKTKYFPAIEYIELFSGDCGQLISLGCFSIFDPYTYTAFEPGNNYYLRVGSFSSPPVLFDICISTPQPDFFISNVFPPDPCEPDNNEVVGVEIQNGWYGTILAGAASVILEVSGANTGTYGPFQNTAIIEGGYGEYITFAGVDLSNPGVNEFKVSGTLIYDLYPENNTAIYEFTGLALQTYFLDWDNDEYGDAGQPVFSCYPYYYYSTNNTDCDDHNYLVHPAATETCNGLDDNCDGLSDDNDPNLPYAYTVIGFKDVYMKRNTVQSGGVGVVNPGKKARLQFGTTVTPLNSFVKAPVLELQGGSQVTTYYPGQVAEAILPAFQANTTPGSNHVTIPNNSSPVTLSLSSYGNIIVGINATVIFSGEPTVRFKELTIKDGATVLFDQPTHLLINKGIAIGKNTAINPGASLAVRFFAQENVTVDRGSNISALIYTKKDLRLEKAFAATPTKMNGLFIAANVFAQDFVNWSWDVTCPFNSALNLVEPPQAFGDILSTAPGSLHIFPNPASAEAQVVFDLETDAKVTLQMLDATGRLVKSVPVDGIPGVNRYPLSLAGLPEGVYLVEVLTEGYRSMGKLAVLRP